MSGIHDLTEKDLQVGCLSLGKMGFKRTIKYSNTKMKIVIFVAQLSLQLVKSICAILIKYVKYYR